MLNKNVYTHSDKPILMLEYGDGLTIDLNHDSTDTDSFWASSAFVHGLDFECWVILVYVAVFSHDVSTVAHEVVVITIKCTVVWIANDPTDTWWSFGEN